MFEHQQSWLCVCDFEGKCLLCRKSRGLGDTGGTLQGSHVCVDMNPCADRLSPLGWVLGAPSLEPIVDSSQENPTLCLGEFAECVHLLQWQIGHLCYALDKPLRCMMAGKILTDGLKQHRQGPRNVLNSQRIKCGKKRDITSGLVQLRSVRNYETLRL
jgi:hypothetical protein